MNSNYICIDLTVLKKKELNLVEKIVLMLLAGYESEEDNSVDKKTILEICQINSNEFDIIINNLSKKGFISPINDKVTQMVFNEIEEEKTIEKHSFTDLRQFIKQPLNGNQEKIILNFAGNDLNIVYEIYESVKEFDDPIDELIFQLQKKGSRRNSQIDFDRIKSLKENL